MCAAPEVDQQSIRVYDFLLHIDVHELRIERGELESSCLLGAFPRSLHHVVLDERTLALGPSEDDLSLPRDHLHLGGRRQLESLCAHLKGDLGDPRGGTQRNRPHFAHIRPLSRRLETGGWRLVKPAEVEQDIVRYLGDGLFPGEGHLRVLPIRVRNEGPCALLSHLQCRPIVPIIPAGSVSPIGMVEVHGHGLAQRGGFTLVEDVVSGLRIRAGAQRRGHVGGRLGVEC